MSKIKVLIKLETDRSNYQSWEIDVLDVLDLNGIQHVIERKVDVQQLLNKQRFNQRDFGFDGSPIPVAPKHATSSSVHGKRDDKSPKRSQEAEMDDLAQEYEDLLRRTQEDFQRVTPPRYGRSPADQMSRHRAEDAMARKIIRDSLSPSLRSRVADMKTAYDIWNYLKPKVVTEQLIVIEKEISTVLAMSLYPKPEDLCDKMVTIWNKVKNLA